MLSVSSMEPSFLQFVEKELVGAASWVSAGPEAARYGKLEKEESKKREG
jgi:hypothetical protein